MQLCIITAYLQVRCRARNRPRPARNQMAIINQVITDKQCDTIVNALDEFRIELPSWGFANTGTRFGKFNQPAAATSTAEKFSDAGQIHRWTGVCPTIALHVLWDLPTGLAGVHEVQALAAEHGLRPGSI